MSEVSFDEDDFGGGCVAKFPDLETEFWNEVGEEGKLLERFWLWAVCHSVTGRNANYEDFLILELEESRELMSMKR